MKTGQLLIKGLSLILISAFATASYAQQARLKYANKIYDNQGYYYASEAYEDVLQRKTDSSEVASNIADSYYKMGNIEKATAWYKYLQRNNNLDKDQHLRLALLERQNANYDASLALFNSYKQKYGDNDVANNYVSASGSVSELQNKNWFTFKPNLSINTPASDMGVNYYTDGEVILVSSHRNVKIAQQVHSWTGDYFYDIFTAQLDEDGNISSKKKSLGKLDEKFHDGPVSYNAKTNTIYFSRNFDFEKLDDNKKSSFLRLFKADLVDGKIKNETELNINGDNFSNTHPSVSKDGKRLYFSSDRPGGKGGMDIYYVKLDSDGNTIGDPINMGDKVNTSENEVFPYYNSAEEILFFSSNGHFGLGGLDVYVSRLDKEGNAKDVENVGAPVNSPYDDFSFLHNDEQTKGFIASNRPGGAGSDDIYAFDQTYVIRNRAVVTGTLKDLITGADIEDGTLYIADKDGNILDSVQSTEGGKFSIPVASEIKDNFKLIGFKDGYVKEIAEISYNPTTGEYNQDLALMPVLDYHFAGTIKNKATGELLDGVKVTMIDVKKDAEFETASTEGGNFKSGNLPYGYKDNVTYRFKLEKEGYVTKTVELAQTLGRDEEILVHKAIDLDLTKIEVGKTDLNEVVEIAPIYFDFDKADIRPDAAKELDKIVAVMNDNPGMVIQLGSHTDNRGSKAYNRTLSDKRAKSSANYIISKGITKDRITGKGFGADKLIVSDAEIAKAKTEEEKEALHQKNRRTEFIVVRMK